MQDMTEKRIEEGSVWMEHKAPQATPREIETAYKDREDVEPYDPSYWEENKATLAGMMADDIAGRKHQWVKTS